MYTFMYRKDSLSNRVMIKINEAFKKWINFWLMNLHSVGNIHSIRISKNMMHNRRKVDKSKLKLKLNSWVEQK